MSSTIRPGNNIMNAIALKRLGVLSLLLCSYLSCFAADRVYDGNWWLSASKQEQTGFIAGYIDCDVYDAGHKELAGVAWNVIALKVTKYYISHKSELQTPVTTVFALAASQVQSRRTDNDGERFPEEHGIFDGEYWRQSRPAHRVGFIEGYLQCQRAEGKPSGNFSQDYVWYVARISDWYGVNSEDPSEIDPTRASQKIADVLYRFRTKSTVDQEQRGQRK